MIKFNRRVLGAMATKGAMLGVPAMGIAYYFGRWEGAFGVLAGEVVMLVNIMGLAWVLGRGLRDDPEKQRRPFGLAALFLLKLLVLFGLSYYVLAVVGLSPIGFVSGCMIALGVMSWQVVATPKTPEEDEASSSEEA